jgi:predicted RNA polymerase sigma factor
MLERMTGNPAMGLNRAVAVAMIDGAAAGLSLLAGLSLGPGGHRLEAVRAHLSGACGGRRGRAGGVPRGGGPND